MKIIISVASYYPSKNGVQAVTQYQAEGLAKKGHDVTVVTMSVNGSPSEEVLNNVKIIRANIYDKYTLHLGERKEYKELILKLTKNADVLVATCLQSGSADLILDIMDNISCPKFLYMHGMHDFKWRKSNFNNLSSFTIKIIRDLRWGLFYPFSYKKIRKFNIISHLHEKDIAYKYFERHNLGKNVVLENAANNVFFMKNIEKIHYLPLKYMISVANYNSRKNQKLILNSFYESNSADYGLVLIGSKSNKYFEDLLLLKKRLDLQYGEKKVFLLKDIPREDVHTYVKNSSFYILASTWEAFPISLIEAMASGIPFISTRVGINEYLPGGIIVSNKENMIYWIENFIKNSESARYLGKSAKIYAEKNLTQKIQNEKFEKYILSIL